MIIYCHNNKIAHKDIKLRNIMMVNNDFDSIKLIDFGCSLYLGNENEEEREFHYK